MAISHLKTFLAIAELGTFVKAAAMVHRTPAAVSQQMKSLEAEMGMPLFDRGKRPPELNPAGYRLVPKARELVDAYESMGHSLLDEMGAAEELIIGPVSTTMANLMPKAVKVMQDGYPKLHIRVYPGFSDDLYTQVDRGFMDAAVITEPARVHDHLHWRPFAEEPLVVIAAQESQFEDPIELLGAYQFIRFGRRAWVGQMIDAWLLQNNVRIRESVEIDALEAVTSWVYYNLGVSIIPLSCCAPRSRFALKMIPLPNSRPRVLGVLSRRDSRKSRHIDELWNALYQSVKPTNRVTR